MATTHTDMQVPFTFGTKAGNLQKLHGTLKQALVCDVAVVTVGQWTENRAECIEQLARRFHNQLLIVRSSATAEDTELASMAGAFDSLPNVPASNSVEVRDAVDSVIASYEAKNVSDLQAQEILIQPMVGSVTAAGVVFTRDLGYNLPYFVLNYEETGRTDGVTSGTADGEQRTYRVHRGIEREQLPYPINVIVAAADELESVTGNSALDVEFAIDGNRQMYLLQVRPLVQTHLTANDVIDRRLDDQIRSMRAFIDERMGRRPGLAGSTTVLGEMPDWNPAEIIGSRPTPLAASIYRFLILNSVWRDARSELGYVNPESNQLLVTVGGRPYIDVRCSFNSLLPAGLPTELAERLIDHYVERLRRNPEFHDKVEFEILNTSLTFDPTTDQEHLREAGFSDAELETLTTLLLTLTNEAVIRNDERTAGFHQKVTEMTRRRREVLDRRARNDDVPYQVEQLLEDCRRLGTQPFSVAARCAFVAISFLRSLVSKGAMSETKLTQYTNAIDTVASAMVDDLDRLRSGALSRAEFLEGYGHLRPGTYDIRAFTYRERLDEYLGSSDQGSGPTATAIELASPEADDNLHLRDVVGESEVEALIAEGGFTFSIDQLDAFIKDSIRQREWLKLEFSKNLSASLDLIVSFARYHGMDRQDVAYLRIGEILTLSNESWTTDEISYLRSSIEHRQQVQNLTSNVPLPDLIFSSQDVELIRDQRRKPNFVTQFEVTAGVVRLDNSSNIPANEELEGKIVLIENADPGFDWLFSKGIAGLCTKYGGAASHMTIRCAEFGIPAAIGCGGQIFDELSDLTVIRLDCGRQTVDGHGS